LIVESGHYFSQSVWLPVTFAGTSLTFIIIGHNTSGVLDFSKSPPIGAVLMHKKILVSIFTAAIGFSSVSNAQVYYQQESVQQASTVEHSYPANGQVYQIPSVNTQTPAARFGGTYSVNGVQPGHSIESTHVRIPWSQKLLESVKTAHDFGAVAALSKQEHIFEFKNTTDETLNLFHVQASCGCTKPTILTPSVAPGETAKVLAQFQTRTFRGEKKATVTVSLDRVGQYTQRGEVQFSVKGKIRKDVVMTPGEVDFSSIGSAEAAQKIVKMKYAGSPLWQILKVKSTNPHLDVEAREISREQSGRVAYELVVKVKDSMPAGLFEEELTVFTNDKNTPQMPVSVSGRVKPALEASAIQLGIVKQGAKIAKRFVVRSETPFSIKEIIIGNDKVKFAPSVGEKSLHVIPYTLDTQSAENIREKVTIITSDPTTPKKVVDFNVRIVPTVVAGSN
jgi:hypothetical protein